MSGVLQRAERSRVLVRERSLTGLLAASAWRLRGLNGWSLEEFTGLRQRGRNKKAAAPGDAWVGLNTATYTLEAKTTWPQSTRTRNLVGKVREKLESAPSQLERLDKMYKQGTIKTAVCYAIPYLRRGARSSQGLIDGLLKEITGSAGLVDGRTVIGAFWYSRKIPEHKGRRYPGVIVVARFWERLR